MICSSATTSQSKAKERTPQSRPQKVNAYLLDKCWDIYSGVALPRDPEIVLRELRKPLEERLQNIVIVNGCRRIVSQAGPFLASGLVHDAVIAVAKPNAGRPTISILSKIDG